MTEWHSCECGAPLGEMHDCPVWLVRMDTNDMMPIEDQEEGDERSDHSDER